MAGLDWRTLVGGCVAASATTPWASAADSEAEVPFYPGFDRLDVEAGGVRFAGVTGGSGPPLLLLHGFPQTHIAWRKVAPTLARHHRLVIPDLPGYGASRPLAMTPRWTKRRVGGALVELMRALGHARFALAGHDRGARAGYRLVLDHPGVITRFASLAVVPTLDAMEAMDYRVALASYHWFLLAQPADLPERLLAAAPDTVIDRAFATMGASEDRVIEPAARDAYRRAFRDPAIRHAMCEDYRAALDEDLALDRADRAAGHRLDCPVHVLWSRENTRSGHPGPLAMWREWAIEVTETATGGSHLQPEDRPEGVLAALLPFFSRLTSGLNDAPPTRSGSSEQEITS